MTMHKNVQNNNHGYHLLHKNAAKINTMQQNQNIHGRLTWNGLTKNHNNLL